jgi:DNA polymerase III subunit chi
MTEVVFYTHAADRLRTICQISAKALAGRRRVMILTPGASVTEDVSLLLWKVPATGFSPHCRSSDPLAAVTPIIVDHLSEPMVHDDVLINLCDDTPACFSRFRRMVEVVGLDDAERAAARARFKFYRDRGYEIRTHPLGKGAA